MQASKGKAAVLKHAREIIQIPNKDVRKIKTQFSLSVIWHFVMLQTQYWKNILHQYVNMTQRSRKPCSKWKRYGMYRGSGKACPESHLTVGCPSLPLRTYARIPIKRALPANRQGSSQPNHTSTLGHISAESVPNAADLLAVMQCCRQIQHEFVVEMHKSESSMGAYNQQAPDEEVKGMTSQEDSTPKIERGLMTGDLLTKSKQTEK